jgi:hypothetical protein
MSAAAPEKPSDYYRDFVVQLEEIRCHKWIESQKAGEDIGFERALTEWMSLHRTAWLKEREKGLAL